MILTRSKLAAATAVAAAFSLVATPAAAIELPRVANTPQAWDADALDVENRRHRGHHGHGDWDDDDIDGDDILAGVLILGGIAAIAGIAGGGKNRQESSYPEPEPYPEDTGYQAPAPETRYRSGGMAEAVDTCVAEVEAGRGPVGSVDRASRSGEGWYVAGELEGGTPFTCWIDGDGRVSDIEAGDYGASYEVPAADSATGEVALAPVQKQAVDPQDHGAYALAQASD